MLLLAICVAGALNYAMFRMPMCPVSPSILVVLGFAISLCTASCLWKLSEHRGIGRVRRVCIITGAIVIVPLLLRVIIMIGTNMDYVQRDLPRYDAKAREDFRNGKIDVIRAPDLEK
jgi:hypothetical protein